MAIGANAAALSKGAIERLERARIIGRYTVAGTAVRAIGWSIVACFAWLAIRELAGQQTSVTISAALSILAEAKIAILVSLAGAAGAWAIVERSLRLRKTEYLQNRNIALEKQVDSRRSSSGLTPQGKTNPRDKRK
jgi:hypothetical protein